MKNVRANLSYWIAGTSLAAMGVVSARWIAPMTADHFRIYLTLGGQLLAIGGLFLICFGVSRRLRSAQETGGA